MSLDLEAWGSRQADLYQLLPRPSQWTDYGDNWAWEGDGWQLLVLKPQPIHRDAVPQEILDVHPDVTIRFEVTIEPIGAPPEATTWLLEVLTSIAQATDGAFVHPESGRVVRADQTSST